MIFKRWYYCAYIVHLLVYYIIFYIYEKCSVVKVRMPYLSIPVERLAIRKDVTQIPEATLINNSRPQSIKKEYFRKLSNPALSLWRTEAVWY